jgi:F-type H+-transporting ATPase subunit delta
MIHQIETPPDAVDKVYAQSLFEAVEARGGREALEGVAAELDELIEIGRGEPRLREFMGSRIIESERREKSLRSIFGGRVDEFVLNLMLLLNKKDRSDRFFRVARAFDEMLQERFGRVEVDVYTRFALDNAQLEGVRNSVRKALGREPVVYTYRDNGMIGGMKIRVGDMLLDASVSTRLRKMRERLKGEGAAVMRTRFDAAIDG